MKRMVDHAAQRQGESAIAGVPAEGAGKPEQGDEGGDHVNHQQGQSQQQDIPGYHVALRRCSEGRDIQ